MHSAVTYSSELSTKWCEILGIDSTRVQAMQIAITPTDFHTVILTYVPTPDQVEQMIVEAQKYDITLTPKTLP